MVLSKGRVRLLRRDSGREVTLGYGVAGELLGEMALVGGASDLEIVATEEIEAAAIPLAPVQELMREDGDFACRLFGVASERRHRAEDRVFALLTRPVESRVVDFLLWAAAQHGVPDSRGTLIGVKFTHREIASYVGSTRETVTLTLGDLKRNG
ncbi:MAG: Crp/Fnr family transcriptional regulator, partial [Myxococcales bacterium]|nr:Crp/Fnr family transcriptional regulator [Myxococcales bacterium]